MSDYPWTGKTSTYVVSEINEIKRRMRSAEAENVDLRQQLGQARKQVANVTGCACNSDGPCKYHAMTSESGRAHILRKQAEAVERMAEKVKEGQEQAAELVTAASIYEGLLGEACKLRAKAEEQEKGGGDHADT